MSSKFSKIEKAKAKLVISDPFYATIVLDLRTVPDTSIPTACTDGTEIRYNPDYMESLPLDECVGVLKHESMHVAGLHPFRGQGKDPEKWNQACDAIINDVLLRKERNSLPEGCVDVNGASQYSPEQYYNMIPDSPKGGGGQGQGQGQQSSGQQGQGQGQQGQSDPLQGDVRPAPDQSETAKAKAKATVTRARNAAKARGLMPAGMEEMLEELLNASVDWKATLRRFLTEVSEDDHSLARPDRRFVSDDIYLPGRFGEDAMGEMAVVMDTSGSVSDRELGQFFGEVASAVAECSPEKLVVVYCDAAVAHVDEFDSPSEAEVATVRKRYGGGGTSMPVGIEYVEDNYPNCKACVVLTDGGTPWGEPSKIPTLWAITESGRVPDWGEHVHVELDDA